LNTQVQKGGPYPTIETRNFLSWAARSTGMNKSRGEQFSEYQTRMCEAFLVFTANWKEEQKYDAIFVDEAHDFDPG
jgi:hypothetical protein